MKLSQFDILDANENVLEHLAVPKPWFKNDCNVRYVVRPLPRWLSLFSATSQSPCSLEEAFPYSANRRSA